MIAIAKEDLESFPHTWTKGFDYELIQKNDYFTLASNEGSTNWLNTIKDQVLVNFEVKEDSQ